MKTCRNSKQSEILFKCCLVSFLDPCCFLGVLSCFLLFFFVRKREKTNTRRNKGNAHGEKSKTKHTHTHKGRIGKPGNLDKIRENLKNGHISQIVLMFLVFILLFFWLDIVGFSPFYIQRENIKKKKGYKK